jgi:hypothetical protein
MQNWLKNDALELSLIIKLLLTIVFTIVKVLGKRNSFKEIQPINLTKDREIPVHVKGVVAKIVHRYLALFLGRVKDNRVNGGS